MKHSMKTLRCSNKLRTLLNGETLLKLQTFRCSASSQENSSSQADFLEKSLKLSIYESYKVWYNIIKKTKEIKKN